MIFLHPLLTELSPILSFPSPGQRSAHLRPQIPGTEATHGPGFQQSCQAVQEPEQQHLRYLLPSEEELRSLLVPTEADCAPEKLCLTCPWKSAISSWPSLRPFSFVFVFNCSATWHHGRLDRFQMRGEYKLCRLMKQFSFSKEDVILPTNCFVRDSAWNELRKFIFCFKVRKFIVRSKTWSPFSWNSLISFLNTTIFCFLSPQEQIK